jgi:hypothetical protein
MRNAPTLALSALFLLLGCKNPGGDDSTSSSSTGDEPHCSEGYGDGPDVDPNYPACGCGENRCEGESACVISGPASESLWTASVCLPPCSDDTVCPTLSGKTTKCSPTGFCRLECGEDSTCPAGYVCGDGGECQVDLTG